MKVSRRGVVTGAGAVLAASWLKISPSSAAGEGASTPPAVGADGASEPSLESWQRLDADIRAGWDADLCHATEQEIRGEGGAGVLFLPFPFVTPTGPDGPFRFMFAWDTDFTNHALIAHGRLDQVRRHLLNQLFMIERFGYVPNANVGGLATRSQTPLIADSLWRYFAASRDRDLLMQAYPLLERNYREYWNGAHHRTSIGLATNRDLGDAYLAPNLAAEAETGLDWTPIFDGDVRRCAPLITNCALVRYARTLARVAKELGRTKESKDLFQDAERRSRLIRQYCWSEQNGMFHEYDYEAGRQLPYVSQCAHWTLWAEVATRAQARALVENLALLEQPHGLSVTDKAYEMPESAHPKDSPVPYSPSYAHGGSGPLQWMYPAGWAPTQLISIEGLEIYGYAKDARRIAAKFLALLLRQHEQTGELWEKYDVVDGSIVLKHTRGGNLPMRGWTAAAAVLLGRQLFHKQTLRAS